MSSLLEAADAKRQDQIPAFELELAGGGQRGDAPEELVAVFGDRRWQAAAKLTDMAVEASQNTIIVASADRKVAVWDSVRGTTKKWLPRSPVKLTSISVLGAEHLIGIGDDRRIYRLKNDAWQRFSNTVGVTAVDKSQDRTRLATGHTDGTVRLWDAMTAEQLGVCKSPAQKRAITRVRFGDGDRLVASAGADGTLLVWNAQTQKLFRSLPPHRAAVRALSFHPTKKLVATGGDDRRLYVWNLTDGERLCEVNDVERVTDLCFNPEGTVIVAATNAARVTFWQWETKKELLHWDAPAARVLYAPRDDRIVTMGGKRLQTWRAKDGKALWVGGGHVGPVSAAQFLNRQSIVTAGADRTIRRWSILTAKVEKQISQPAAITQLSWAGGSRSLFACRSSNAPLKSELRLQNWADDSATPKNLWLPPALATAKQPIRCLAVSADGKQVAVAWNQGRAWVWPVEGAGGAAINLGKVDVDCLAFYPNGVLIAGGADGAIAFWDLKSKQRLLQLNAGSPVKSLAVSPDGRRLIASGAGRQIKIWDLTTLKQRAVAASAAVSRVMFGPFGDQLLSVVYVKDKDESQVSIWNPSSGKLSQQILVRSTRVSNVGFSPTGRHLVTANDDGSIYLLRLASLRAPQT